MAEGEGNGGAEKYFGEQYVVKVHLGVWSQKCLIIFYLKNAHQYYGITA